MSDQPGIVFDRVAEDYERARSDYPALLVDRACALAGMLPGAPVLEIGCGTGKLTRALAARGLRVDAVDPGPNMIEIARRTLPDGPVSFHLGRFEDLPLPAQTFEAVFSATAFHWIDPAIGWQKVARLLRPGGVLALITHVAGGTDIDREYLAAWREVSPEAATWEVRDPETVRVGAEARRANVSEVWAWVAQRELGRPEAALLFHDTRIESVPVEGERTAEQSLALIRTTSSYLRLDDQRRRLLERRLSAMIERAGGTVRSTNYATLVTARAR